MASRSRRMPAVPGSILTALRGGAEGLDLTPADAAVLTLAEKYAQAIDDGADTDALDRYGPKLLSALAHLGMTPQARAMVAKGGAPSARSRLDALRAARTS